MLARTPYRATIYRWRKTGVNAARQAVGAWEAVAGLQDLPCDRETRDGKIDRQPFGAVGQSVVTSWFQRADIRRGDGISYTHVEEAGELVQLSPPENFEVRHRQYLDDFDELELIIEETAASFT